MRFRRNLLTICARIFVKGVLMLWQHLCRLVAWGTSGLVTVGVLATGAAKTTRTLGMEPLEPRLALAAAGLVEVGSQPSGGLDGKIVYLHAGHGYTANNLGSGAWTTQRGLGLGMVEDLGNKDQMDFLADYLFRAGATIVPLRPIGHQPNEVILDNDARGVTWHGNWSNSTAGIYFGSPGDIPYRYASTSPTETAYARYRPNLPEAGFYPVYTWVRYGSDRAADQLYRVHHAGGTTEVTINHRQVGNGPIYLGTYYFEAGSAGYVDISNRSSEPGRVVIADMIRFGNGIGDIDRGGGVSGQTREDEAGLYWVKWHVDHSVGIPDSEYRATSDDRDATVSLAPRYAEYMNRQQEGSLADRVFVSFHSNAGGGGARGVLGLYNGNNNPSSATPNQFLLAQSLAKEVNDDLVAQNGRFEHNWHNRGNSVTLDRSDIEFGEINNQRINGEFDATIVEVAFHDNSLDAQLMLDPKVRDAVARATYQGLLKYFHAVDGTTPTTPLPSPVTQVSARTTAPGSVTLNWTPPVANSWSGGAATSYVVYASTGGYGFDGGRVVAGGSTNTFTIEGLDPNETYYFTVVARNNGGESARSEVVAAVPRGSAHNVLIVNGFDRLDRTLNPTQPYHLGGEAQRVRPRQSNSFDYAVQVASALHQSAPHLAIDTASNEQVASGAVSLAAYDAVFWILGEESTANRTFDAAEQSRVTNYLNQGGKLFVSGSEIGWDLDQANNGRTFYNSTLKADYVKDDAAVYTAQGAAGSIFAGLSVTFDDGTFYYDVDYPDVISPLGGAQLAMNYPGGGGAAVQFGNPGGTQLVMLAFPFETIVGANMRGELMTRVVDFFALENPPPDADFNRDGVVDAADFVVWRNNLGKTVPVGTRGDANFDALVTIDDYLLWKEQFGASSPRVGEGAGVVGSTPARNQGLLPPLSPGFRPEQRSELVDRTTVGDPLSSSSSTASRQGELALLEDPRSIWSGFTRESLGPDAGAPRSRIARTTEAGLATHNPPREIGSELESQLGDELRSALPPRQDGG